MSTSLMRTSRKALVLAAALALTVGLAGSSSAQIVGAGGVSLLGPRGSGAGHSAHPVPPSNRYADVTIIWIRWQGTINPNAIHVSQGWRVDYFANGQLVEYKYFGYCSTSPAPNGWRAIDYRVETGPRYRW